jgi:hypothetical protein
MKEIDLTGCGLDHHTKNEVDWLGITHRYPSKPLAHFFMVWVRPFKKIGGFGYVLILKQIKYNNVWISTNLMVFFLKCKF